MTTPPPSPVSAPSRPARIEVRKRRPENNATPKGAPSGGLQGLRCEATDVSVRIRYDSEGNAVKAGEREEQAKAKYRGSFAMLRMTFFGVGDYSNPYSVFRIYFQ